MLTEVTTVGGMRLMLWIDACRAAVQAMRRPDPAAEAARVEREANALADVMIEQGTLLRYVDPNGTLSPEMVANEAAEWKRTLSPGSLYVILSGPRKTLLEQGVIGPPTSQLNGAPR